MPSLNIKLLPALAAGAPREAEDYGLTVSALVSILVWNDSLKPDRALCAIPSAGKLVRAHLGCSLRTEHFRRARARAKTQHMSVNSYLEALIAAQLARPASALVVFRLDRKT